MLVTRPFPNVSFLQKLRERNDEVDHQFSFLRRFFTPRTVFMHFGAGDCSLALQAASYVERVYAVDAQEGIASGVRLPCNLRFVDSRDLWTVGGCAVDLGFSDGLPAARLREICWCLAPRGAFVFQSNEKPRLVRAQLRDAGFSAVRSSFLANLLRNPAMLEAIK